MYRIFRMKEQTRLQFRSAPHTSGEACYSLTSAAIEVRAHCLYPAYQQILKQHDSPISVASILADEAEHLQAMSQRLPQCVPDWRATLERVMRAEAQAFETLLDALERAMRMSR